MTESIAHRETYLKGKEFRNFISCCHKNLNDWTPTGLLHRRQRRSPYTVHLKEQVMLQLIYEIFVSTFCNTRYFISILFFHLEYIPFRK